MKFAKLAVPIIGAGLWLTAAPAWATAVVINVGWEASTVGGGFQVETENLTPLTGGNSIDFGAGDFTVTLDVFGTPPNPQPGLMSAATTVSEIPAADGSVTIFITEQNLTAPLTGHDIESIFSQIENTLPTLNGGGPAGGAPTATETTYINTDDAQFGPGLDPGGATKLSTTTFTGAGVFSTTAFAVPPTLSGAYSETEVFTVTPNACGSPCSSVTFSGSIDMQVPEPSTLTLLGVGLLGIPLLRRRKAA